MYSKQVVCGLRHSGPSTFVISGQCCWEQEKDIHIVSGTCNDRCRPIPGWSLTLGRGSMRKGGTAHRNKCGTMAVYVKSKEEASLSTLL